MRLSHGIHLAYCTNIHRGGDWPETFHSLNEHTLRVRERVAAGRPYAIGLRLGDTASRQLGQADELARFRAWLDENDCYVFTINGFPHGDFHGNRVKEQVYQPDWTTPERVEYTKRLFDILAEIAPAESGGSVSTVPCSFKEFISSDEQVEAMRRNLWEVVQHIDALSEQSGKDLHLGLEPEPLCYLETSDEMIRFYHQLRDDRPRDDRLAKRLGINYDTCHLAVEFEEAADALRSLAAEGIRISKLHFSSALKVRPSAELLDGLAGFAEDIYFHQVVVRGADGGLKRYRDLPEALAAAARGETIGDAEWRIHFHVPLHCPPTTLFDTTADQLQAAIAVLGANPSLCSHVEMETYTWEVLPSEMKQRDVVDQLAGEYDWTLAELARHGITPVD
ncbi:MAG: metabolite traffic protein EboE [Verrucomicrobiota bacterium]|nr:metabolite traffic protein EboE [Verrucomicrobiota bacterium]